MAWVGNDLVSLQDPANLRSPMRPGYMEKCCTGREMDWISGQEDKIPAFWQLWAAKEAAYKIGMKMDQPYHFQPRLLEVTVDGSFPAEEGYVDSPFGMVPVWWMVDPTFIHALAALDIDRKSLQPAVFPLGNEDESDLTQERLLNGVSRFYHIPRTELSLQWIDQKIPQLCHRSTPMSLDCSMSHDGPWGAFVFATYAQVETRT